MKQFLSSFLILLLAGVPAIACGWDTPDLSGKTFCSEEQTDLIADGEDYYDEDEADEDI